MANTTSQPASSTGLSTILPPLAASGSALARVRFQIVTSMAGLEQALRHGRAHAADPDPADLLCIVRHPETPVATVCAALAVRASLWKAFGAHYPAPQEDDKYDNKTAFPARKRPHGE